MNTFKRFGALVICWFSDLYDFFNFRLRFIHLPATIMDVLKE